MLCCIQDWFLVMNFLEPQLGFSVFFSTQVVLLNMATSMEMYFPKRVLKSLLRTIFNHIYRMFEFKFVGQYI